MKPLNLDNSPCSPISSNCVIWQGPDIPCISLCTGDTVSTVIAKLAEELCCMLTTLDINSYDLSCFNINQSKPEDFKAFIQFLVERICALENIDPHTHEGLGEGECPSGCIVTVAEPFQEDGHTTMNLTDYALAMGNKIADNITEISVNKTAIADHEVRITTLEVAPAPTFTLPDVTPTCVLPSIPTPMDQVLTALETDYCNLRTSTGTSSDVSAAVAAQCVADTDLSKTNPANAMITEYAGTWVTPAVSLADSVTNLWVALCDVRDASEVTITVNDTDTIDLDLTLVDRAYTLEASIIDTGWQDLEGFDHYPGTLTKPQVRRFGKELRFRGIAIIPLSSDGGATLIPMAAVDTYNANTEIAPYTGTGGVTLVSAGAVYFNNNTSVLPAGVLGTASKLDASYISADRIAVRPIDLNASYGTALSAHVNLGISDDGKLYLSTLKDLELTTTRGGGYTGTSALRMITSNVRQGAYVPDYRNASSYIHNGGNGASAVTINAAGAGYTNGSYTVSVTGGSGKELRVAVTISGNALTSIDEIVEPGFGYSNTDTALISRELDSIAGGAGAQFNVEGVTNSDNSLNTEVRNVTWPFSCDAAEETDLGAFQIRLDGLTAYID